MPCTRWNVGSTMFGSSKRTFCSVGIVDREVRGSDVLREREVFGRDGVEAERCARRLDVAGDVGQLLGRLGRLDLEPLDERGIRRARDDRDERPQPDRDDGENPAPPADVDDQQHGGAERDEDQQVDRRELCLGVGVSRTVDEPS